MIKAVIKSRGPGISPRLLWMWSLASFIGKRKKSRSKRNSQLFDSPSSCCIYPATWNLSDIPGWSGSVDPSDPGLLIVIWIISKECACTLYVIPPIEPGVPWAMGYQYNNQMPPPLPQRRKVFITFIGIILKENPFVFPLKSSSYLMKYTFSCCISALLFSVFPQSKICFHFYAFEGDLYL